MHDAWVVKSRAARRGSARVPGRFLSDVYTDTILRFAEIIRGGFTARDSGGMLVCSTGVSSHAGAIKAYFRVCVCVCLRARARARVRACMRSCVRVCASE